jgi:hypothetical protein
MTLTPVAVSTLPLKGMPLAAWQSRFRGVRLINSGVLLPVSN